MSTTIASLAALGPTVRIEYSRPIDQSAKPPQQVRVRLFAVPSGAMLYRIVFTARPAEFDKLADTFQRILDSIRLTPAAAKDEQP
jgi:hypothetical protein